MAVSPLSQSHGVMRARPSSGRSCPSQHRHVPLPRFLLAVALVVHTGCASPPPPPPSAAVRATLGTIGVVGGELGARLSIPAPPGRESPGKGTRAAAGAGVGAGMGALYGLGAGVSFPPSWIVLVPAGIITGGIAGAVLGASAAEKQTREHLRQVLGDQPLTDPFVREVFRAVQFRTAHRAIWLAEWPQARVEGPAVASSAPPDAVDTVLEVSLVGGGLRDDETGGAWFRAFMIVRTRLVRVTDSAELHAREWEEQGGAGALATWAAGDWQPLRDEFGRMAPPFAARIVDELFGVDPAGPPVD